jgi:transposase-like protein
LVRRSLRYLSWRERKSCAGELRRIYTAADADAARQVLDEHAAAWAGSKTRPPRSPSGNAPGDRVIPFLAFLEEIRRIAYTTNTVQMLARTVSASRARVRAAQLTPADWGQLRVPSGSGARRRTRTL